jgi:hypothetical protein
MSKIIPPDIISVSSIGNGYKKKMENCAPGFNQTKTGCMQNCPNNTYINNICRCNINKDCVHGFTCLNNLCMSTDEKCPVKHKKVKNMCIQECIDPKNQNDPVCKCTVNEECHPEQICDKDLKSCTVKPESLGNSLGISPNFEAQIKSYQDMKNGNTYNLFLLVPVVVILLVYYVLKKFNFPLRGFISELLIIASVLFINYLRFYNICDSTLVISGTIRKSVIILGLSSLLVRVLAMMPPSRAFILSIGQPAIGWFMSISILLIFIINNHFDDDLDGQKYDCNYILGLDTVKDINKPSNIMFLVGLFMIGVRLYSAFMIG